MYESSETDISRRHLEEVISSIEEPIVVLGGWAVYFLVSNGYRETTGREYIGSRDIDLGFHMDEKDMDNTAFAKAFRKLTEDLGFKLLSFRLLQFSVQCKTFPLMLIA